MNSSSTQAVATLQALLVQDERPDLADALTGTTLTLRPSFAYGSYTQTVQSQLVFTTSPQSYLQLTRLNKADYTLLLICAALVYPPSSGYEVTQLVFEIAQTSEHTTLSHQLHKLARSWHTQARDNQKDAEQLYTERRYAQCICTAQECIELSIKALSILLTHTYPKRHELKRADIQLLLTALPYSLQDLELPKLFLYAKFWNSFYTTAKYGYEEFSASSELLFSAEEASLALQHSQFALTQLAHVEHYISKKSMYSFTTRGQ